MIVVFLVGGLIGLAFLSTRGQPEWDKFRAKFPERIQPPPKENPRAGFRESAFKRRE